MESESKSVSESIWEEVKPDVKDLKEEGDTCEGFFISVATSKDEDISRRYYFEKDGVMFFVWGSANLDERIRAYKIGDYLRITYNGKKDIGKGKTLKLFTVERKKIEQKEGNAS